MAVLQALISLIGRSAGKILNAVFGWAVRALFGSTSGAEQTLLTGLVAGAAVWPLLLGGIAFPRVAAFALAFVPIPDTTPDWIIRAVWIALALAVPVVLGVVLAAKQPPDAPRESFAMRAARGFPLTLGIAIAFWISFVAVPLQRVATLVRRHEDAYVPLVTTRDAYGETAERVCKVLGQAGYALAPREPSWWVRAPMTALRKLGGAAMRGYVPERLAHFTGPALAVTLHPSSLLLRGEPDATVVAHGLVAESLAAGEALQTTDPDAQRLEREITRVWRTLDEHPAHVGSALLASRVNDIARDLTDTSIAYDDWQILYRQLLQLDRALRGEPQLLAYNRTDGTGETSMAQAARPYAGERTPAAAAAQLSTGDLLREITSKASLLALKEVELARAELKEHVDSQLAMAKSLAIAAVFGLAAFVLLLVAGVFALTQFFEGWLAALIVAGACLLVAGLTGWLGWRKRLTRPLARTRRTLKEDLRWAKEAVA
jgi:hypothetical protein